MGRLYNHMDESLKQMKLEANALKKQLKSLPNGNLLLRNRKKSDGDVRKNYCYHYRDEGNMRKQRIIKNDEDILFKELVRKRMIKRALPLYKNNIDALEKCLSKYKDFSLYTMMEEIPNAYEAVSEIVTPPSKYESDVTRSFKFENRLWNELEEQKNKFHDEMLRNGDINFGEGTVVFRSKSEYIIASLLKEYGISYKYEVPVCLSRHTIYPDFALRRSNDGHVMFWEHFGLINDSNYREKMYRKLSEYSQCGLTLWDNLITTSDLPEGGIDTSLIRKIINVFILC